MIYVVGISGKAGGGKDTFADMIEKKLTEKSTDAAVVRLYFAKKVKDFGVEYFGRVCDPVVKDAVSRAVLQGIGQMMRSEVNEDFWVDQARKELVTLVQSTYGRVASAKDIYVLIPDMRYPNEADAIRGTTGAFYKGPGGHIPLTVRLTGRTSLEGEAAQHLSETALDNYVGIDEVYENTGTLEDLENFAESIITKLGESRENN